MCLEKTYFMETSWEDKNFSVLVLMFQKKQETDHRLMY